MRPPLDLYKAAQRSAAARTGSCAQNRSFFSAAVRLRCRLVLYYAVTYCCVPEHKGDFRMTIKIAPSILSADFANLQRDIERISTADLVHVDVMDGIFVPNISIGIPVVQSLRPTTALPLDIHLMITQPVRYVEQFCDAGADIVTCHVEADTPENIHKALALIHAKGKKAGVVLKPNTRAEAVLPFINEVDMILVMTVEPGFGGQKFMADMMPKVHTIRGYIDEMNPACDLEVDGGIDPDTAPLPPLRQVQMYWLPAVLYTRLPISLHALLRCATLNAR